MLQQFIFLALGISYAQTAPPPENAWTPQLAVRLRSVSPVIPSPDGKWVVYAHKTDVTQLFLASADGTQRRQLTRGEKPSGNPTFSPDGRLVYFATSRNNKSGLWRIAIDGGEAELVAEGNFGGWRLSPDGASIAFMRADASPEKKSDAQVIGEFHANRLWVIPTEADSSGKRTPRKILDAPLNVGAPDWSPDSRFIAFDYARGERQGSAWKETDIGEVEVATGKMRVLAETPAGEGSPKYSPDGRYVAFVRTSTPAHWAHREHLVVLPRQGGAARQLAATPDEWPTLIGWTGDSKRLLFLEDKGVSKVVGALPLDGSPVVVYQPERGVVDGAWIGGQGKLVGISQQFWNRPSEAYLLPIEGRPVQVSRANDGIPKLPLGETRVIRWKAKDGWEIEGLLTLPVGYEKGKRYPLVMLAHGGPANAFRDVFIGSTSHPNFASFAVLAAKGYASLRCNVRGSSGYGAKFRWANIGDWGGGDYEDLMAGLDHLIVTGIADPDRLAIAGSSYGGFMTSWAIGQTKRFKAAINFAGVTNLWSFTGTTDIPDFMPDWFGAEPWQNFETYVKHSPMSYAKAMSTPTLIFHGANDDRVNIGQSYELYNALKRRGVPVKMVVYPREYHGIGDPKHVVDAQERSLEWLDKYLK